MLGRRDPQIKLADVDEWWKAISPQTVWGRIREWVGQHFRDEDFAAWYSTTGRPSIPPTYILTLVLLQFRQGWSDRQAVEEAQFDDRVKFALGVSRSPEITCDHSTLCKYRARFLDKDLGRALLRQTLADAQAAGLLGDAEDLVDSFMVAGAAARQGTLTLIRQAVRLVLAEMEDAGFPFPALQRNDYGARSKPAIDWNDAGARDGLLQELVADSRMLSQLFQDRKGLPVSLRQALDLLDMVTEQDITTDDQGHVTIAQQVAKDRIISVVDSDMRHGRKSTSQKFDGYKAHVSSQNQPVGKGAFVTGVVVTGGNIADGDAAPMVLDDREKNTGSLPENLMGDTSYGSTPVRAAIAEVAPEIVITAPVPPSPNRKGRFPKNAFAIDLEGRTITCPAENTVTIPEQQAATRPGRSQTVTFPVATCAGCALREQCVGGSKGPRHVTVATDEAFRQAERKRQAEPAWLAHYRERSRIEHVNRLLAMRGGRTSRYWGRIKTEFQLVLVSVTHNIAELGRMGVLAGSS